MNGVIALLWLPPRVLQATQLAVHRAATSWAHAWGLASPEQPEVCAVAKWPDVASVGLNLAADDTPPDVWIQTLTSALFAGHAGGSVLAGRVAADSTAQLRNALRQALGLAGEESDPDAAGDAPGHVGVLVRQDILGCTWEARVPHAALFRCGLLQRPKQAPVSRWNAEQALAATPVPVQAVLGHVQVDMRDVLELALGDVLLMPQLGLDAAVQVRGVGTPLTLQARLGATESRRGVQWLADARGTY